MVNVPLNNALGAFSEDNIGWAVFFSGYRRMFLRAILSVISAMGRFTFLPYMTVVGNAYSIRIPYAPTYLVN